MPGTSNSDVIEFCYEEGEEMDEDREICTGRGCVHIIAVFVMRLITRKTF
jgi:hypothetical protein